MMAGANGHVEIVKELLKRGADATLMNEEGNTALHWACMTDQPVVADVVLAAGCDSEVKNQAGLTAVMQAANLGHNEVMGAILKYEQAKGPMEGEEAFDDDDEIDGDQEVEVEVSVVNEEPPSQ
eukprot:TRINITY_DN22791_c0_g1_i3.p1 TRINITY_DN22791_c0_g1~~TRINITY_DN22791_c0_g1_i3.p1  ORF type:complete len:124 (-),score=31.90 TRINITY_DN22791_c0_g1_i3:364-735(-)